MRHIYTIHCVETGEPAQAQIEACNNRQALREFGKRIRRDQMVPLNEFVKGYTARYLCKQDGRMPVYCRPSAEDRNPGQEGQSSEKTAETACTTCQRYLLTGGPSHQGSSLCRSGSLASGGTRAHCTCDTCF